VSLTLFVYPETPQARDRWIVARRSAREIVDPRRPFGFFVEDERTHEGSVVPVATLFLTNRECPWRCLMCDLWRHTLTETVDLGAIPAQIDHALERLPAARHIKLYNGGSFFDRGAIPVEDYPAIALRVSKFERVIAESHPALVGDLTLRFRELLTGHLEVAMGLETVHPEILPRLNKRMSLDQFAGAAEYLCRHEIALRAFVLVKPPFMREGEAVEWAARSLEFAFDCGATAVTLIPTRAGNGAMDRLAEAGDFAPPTLETLEKSIDYGLRLKRGRVFVDLWDVCASEVCAACFDARVARLRAMNFEQRVRPAVRCSTCGAGE
jgi:radical SAM enzyme (TIGR01210 family)